MTTKLTLTVEKTTIEKELNLMQKIQEEVYLN